MSANPYALAAELARPVARGYLTRTDALSEMLTSTLALARRNEIAGTEPTDVFRLQRHLFFQHLGRLEANRAIAEMRMTRRLRPLIALRKPSNVLAAEAHDVNGAEGFPFDEQAVNDITAREVFFAGRQRHG